MGKHDINEHAPAIHKDVEKHYKDVIALKNAQLEEAKELVSELKLEIERLKFEVRLKDVEIQALVKNLAGGGN